jgi:uncharacterized protein YaiI (UPF0178 family)
MTSATTAISIYVDADACPVKDECLRVAERHGAAVHYVANSWMRLPDSPLVHRVVVAEGPDAADMWIAERIAARDIVVTADVPLAARCLAQGARGVSPMGKVFTDANIGMILAMRDLMKDLRDSGAMQTYNAAFTRAHRSEFLQQLENLVQQIKRAAP